MVQNPFSRGLSVKVGGDVSGATTALASLRGSLATTATRVTALGGVLGGALAVGGLGVATNAAADFDEKMQESMAVMGNVSDTMRDDLENRAREVANTTTASAEEAAESYYFLASAGLDASESLEAMPTVAEFAEAGNLEMAQATDYATDIMSAFGKDAEDMTEVTDRLTATVTRHNQTMDGMGQAMSMVAPIASGLGVSIAETSTLIGTLGDAGIKGSRAGRTLRQAFNRLNNVSGPAKETLEELGVQVQDGGGEMRDMTEIIEDLNEAGASTGEVMEIFGARAGPGMQVLLEEGADSIEEETEKIDEMEGKTEDVARTQRQTFNKQLDIAKSRLNDIAIEIGRNVLPMLIPLLDRFKDFVSDSAAIGDAIASKVKPALKLFMNGVSGLIDTFQESDSLADFVKTLIGDAVSWIQNEGVSKLKSIGSDILGFVTNIIDPDGEDSDAGLVGALINRLNDMVSGAVDWVEGDEGGNKIGDIITGLLGALADTLGGLSESDDDVSNLITNIGSLLRKALRGVAQALKSDEFKEVVTQLGNIATNLLEDLADQMLDYAGSDEFKADLRLVVGAIVESFAAVISQLDTNLGPMLFDELFGGLMRRNFGPPSEDYQKLLEGDMSTEELFGMENQTTQPNAQTGGNINRTVEVLVEGDTGVIKNVTAQEIDSRERTVNRQSGRSPSPGL